MKVGTFTTTNDKGQIVIPKDIRDSLSITSDVTLNITLAGDGMYIYPVEEFITKSDLESSYLDLLQKTKGSWGEDSDKQLKQQKKDLELKASESRKRSW